MISIGTKTIRERREWRDSQTSEAVFAKRILVIVLVAMCLVADGNFYSIAATGGLASPVPPNPSRPAIPTAGAIGGPSGPAWLSYDRPATSEVVVNEIDVPMRDGVAMRCTFSRPGHAGQPALGRYPVLVSNFFAYRLLQVTNFHLEADRFAARGYAVLECSPRGSGGTPGEWRPFGEQERRDLYDLIEWAGTQPWSSGKVGQTGISYGGISSYKAATTGAPHLAAVAPIVGYSDFYSEMIYPGGVRGSVLRWWPAATWALSVGDQNPADAVTSLPEYAAFEERAQQHPTRDAYWQELAIDAKALDAGNVPVLNIGGWHDLFTKGTVDNYLAAKDQSWLMMFPWAHADFMPGLPDFAVVERALLAWFDHWLMDMPQAPLPSARVTSWQLPKRTGEWVELPDWPGTNKASVLHLNANRTLGQQPGASAALTYPVNPFDNGCACMESGLFGSPDDPTNDQRLADATRLDFDSPLLKEKVVIAGEPTGRIRAALSTTDGNLVVRLNDVAPDGTSYVITTGWLRASHQTGDAQPTPRVPNQVYDYRVALRPTHWTLAAGHRLRVSVSSGDLAKIEPNATLGTVTVLSGEGGSTIEVPIEGRLPQ